MTTEIVPTLLGRGCAVFSTDRVYRYRLSRAWDIRRPCWTFVLLNPSTADERQDDPTIRRCIRFARSWGAGALWIGNLFAFRATDPKQMLGADDPVGPGNFRHLNAMSREAAASGGQVVCAWGVHGSHLDQDKLFLKWLDALDIQPFCLGVTMGGSPRHPLYLRNGLMPAPLPRLRSSERELA